MRRKAALLSFLFVLMSGVGVSRPVVHADEAPQMVVPENRYDFGSILEGLEVRHDFVIENRGAAPLIIQRVQPD